jgi:L,D-transpeptidase ErfK/SrfK
MAITHGCIRMYPEDVAALFPLVPVGTKVWLINDPVKVAYVDGELLLEAHPPVDSEGQTTEPNLELLSQQLDKAVGSDTAAIHWDLARETLQAANGIPAVVGLQADLSPESPNGAAPQIPGAVSPSPGVAGAAASGGGASLPPAPTKTLAPVYAPGTGPGTTPPAATAVPKPTSAAAPRPPAPN